MKTSVDRMEDWSVVNYGSHMEKKHEAVSLRDLGSSGKFTTFNSVFHQRLFLRLVWCTTFLQDYYQHYATACYHVQPRATVCYCVLHAFTCCYMLLHPITSYYILCHAITCYYMLLHAITCHYMLLHFITCYCMLLQTITY